MNIRSLFLLATILLFSSCGEDGDTSVFTTEDLLGTWNCLQTTRTACETGTDNGSSSCDGSSLTFSDDNTFQLVTGTDTFNGTFSFSNNLLTLFINISGVPGLEDRISTSDPIEISISNGILTYRQTTKDLDNCITTSTYEQ